MGRSVGTSSTEQRSRFRSVREENTVWPRSREPTHPDRISSVWNVEPQWSLRPKVVSQKANRKEG